MTRMSRSSMRTMTLVPRRRLLSPMWCRRLFIADGHDASGVDAVVAHPVVGRDLVSGGQGLGPVVECLDGGGAVQPIGFRVIHSKFTGRRRELSPHGASTATKISDSRISLELNQSAHHCRPMMMCWWRSG